jgi:uncharacterized protein YbbC (DUF1343 family)
MKPKVRFGIDVLLKEKIDLLEGKRIGLVTNHTGVTSALEWTVDALHRHPKVRLVCLYGPEHGIRGDVQDALKIDSFMDSRTGLQVHSLYGEHTKPTPNMMKEIDAFVFDIQEVGARYYTYIATMNRCMEAASEQDKEFFVLDRPNPITGTAVEGNILEERYRSFVGERPIPIRHGMTMGELARMFNEEYDIGCKLTVIKAEGWKREMWYDETGLPWVMPSPNLPTLETAVVYPGTCLFEGVNISEGRGTTRPFEMIGAPWIDGFKLTDKLKEEGLPGVVFRGLHFIPTVGKFAGEVCGGVQLHVCDRRRFKPVLTALTMFRKIMDLFPSSIEFRKGWRDEDYSFDLLAGTDSIRRGLIEGKEPRDIEAGWDKELRSFLKSRRKYLLYP